MGLSSEFVNRLAGSSGQGNFINRLLGNSGKSEGSGKTGQYSGLFGSGYDTMNESALFDTRYFDQNYAQWLNFIEQYKDNPELYERLKTLFQFTAYTPSNKEFFWGDTAGIRDYYNNEFKTAMNNAYQLIDEYNQRSYNDPTSQLSRERAAGLNPELNGGEGLSPGEAGDATPDPIPNESPAHEAGSPGFDFAQMGMNFITGLTSLIGGVQALGMNYTQQGLLSTALSDSAMDVALKEEAAKYRYPTLENGDVDYSAVPELVVPDSFKNGRPKGAAGKALERARGNLYGENGEMSTALKRAIMAHQKGLVENTVAAGTGMATPGYSESIEDFAAGYSEIIVQKQIDALDWDNRLRKLDARFKAAQSTTAEAYAGQASRVASAEASAAESKAREAYAQAGFAEGYYSEELGQSKATAEQLENELSAIEDEIAKEQEATWKAIQDYVKDPKHGRLGKFGITLLPGLRQEVDRIFETRRESIRTRRESLRKLGDGATNAIVGAITK